MAKFGYFDRNQKLAKKETEEYVEELRERLDMVEQKLTGTTMKLQNLISHTAQPKHYKKVPAAHYATALEISPESIKDFLQSMSDLKKELPTPQEYKFSEREVHKSLRREAHFDLIVRHYHLAEQDMPLFDGCSKYETWFARGDKIVGMRHRETELPHGIVRIVEECGRTFIGTQKQGVWHGLGIQLSGNDITVGVQKDGEEMSSFTFDRKFIELRRQGSLLDHLSPEHFDPKCYNPKPFAIPGDSGQPSNDLFLSQSSRLGTQITHRRN